MLVTFSPFPKMFSTLSETNFNFYVTFILSSAKAFNLDQSKILSFGKGLKQTVHIIDVILNTKQVIKNSSPETEGIFYRLNLSLTWWTSVTMMSDLVTRLEERPMVQYLKNMVS